MIKISFRLKFISSLVDERIVADVGCDHGKLVRKLFDENKIDFAYVSDISRGSLQKAIDLRNTISGRRYSDIILTAQKLIREEYMSEEISLNVVAARVCMSPSYFSTIFSKETGKTFIEYLTEVRMEKAKEYLVCTNRKTSDIAFEIGYKDPHYFSFLFKKTQGCTPKEYRTSRKEW